MYSPRQTSWVMCAPFWQGSLHKADCSLFSSLAQKMLNLGNVRYFLDNVAEYILELDRGEGFPFKGNYSGFMEKKLARLDSEAKVDNKRKKALEKELEVKKT